MESFRFIKVEEFFRDYKNWDKIDKVDSHTYDPAQRRLSLSFTNSGNMTCCMLLYFPRKDTVRVRFNPGKKEYPDANTRSIVMNTFTELSDTMDKGLLGFKENKDKGFLEITTKDDNENPFMRLVVNLNPFKIDIFRFNSEGEPFLVLADSEPSLYYQKRLIQGKDTGDFSIIQSKMKPGTAKYIGFGEKGGANICQNGNQLTYFNYDNMRYKQIYNRSALEYREPLYDSNPFFMEFYGVPDKNSIYGIFVDNPSETYMDIGYLNSNRYMFGSIFYDLDYYIFLGDNCAEVMESYTSFVGHARLKPRFVLGYHQGCYGYDTRAKVDDVANKYRQNRIPIDGLHIDVDIQRNYQTFTIDEEKFPNPKEMFSRLKEKGFKCSTNITPIISNKDPNYQTYQTGMENQYFVKDTRCEPLPYEEEYYQDYDEPGIERNKPLKDFNLNDLNYNTGKPYIGEVYYGGDRGTTGHYPDFGKKDVRAWWGQQFKFLFEMGLEMVWQDMTTPSIRNTRGDMKSFPFKLMLTDNFLTKYYGESEGNRASSEESEYPKAPAIKIWNLYSYNLHKATYQGINNLGIAGRENKRNFIIGRGGFTGMHRFAGLWTGDNASDWRFLKINIPQVLALGISGQAVAGEDIGGFETNSNGEGWADPELLIRWTITGAFLPWFRNHYMAKESKKFQEPYAYQDVINQIPQNERDMYRYVLPICRYYIELRYRLMQLFYDAMFENTLNGMPIARAMVLNDCEDTALFNDKIGFLSDQFFVRRDLLVAPVIEKQSLKEGGEGRRDAYLPPDGKRDVYLPSGSEWYTFMDNKQPLISPFEGGSTIDDYDAKIDPRIDTSQSRIGFILPLFVRSGAVIPTIELEQYVGELHAKGQPNPITINVYPDRLRKHTKDNSYTYIMYLDDGESRSSAPAGDPKLGVDPKAQSKYRSTQISHYYSDKNIRSILVDRLHDQYTPMENYFFVTVLHDPKEATGVSGSLKSIKVLNREIPFLSGGSLGERVRRLNQSNENAWYYNENTKISFIKIFDNNASIPIQLEYVKQQ